MLRKDSKSKKNYLYKALRRSSSSGGLGGARYSSAVNICSSFAARPNFKAAILLDGNLVEEGACGGDETGRGEDVCLVKQTLLGRAGTDAVLCPTLVFSMSSDVMNEGGANAISGGDTSPK